MTKGVVLTAAAALVLAGGAALAEPRHDHGLLERLDANGDGAISRAEARTMGDRRFQRWDRDGDGAVTEAEMVEAAQERLALRIGKMFARLDRNDDGRLERAEIEARADARFERMDADGDGRVPIADIRARWQERMHHRRGEARSQD